MGGSVLGPLPWASRSKRKWLRTTTVGSSVRKRAGGGIGNGEGNPVTERHPKTIPRDFKKIVIFI